MFKLVYTLVALWVEGPLLWYNTMDYPAQDLVLAFKEIWFLGMADQPTFSALKQIELACVVL